MKALNPLQKTKSDKKQKEQRILFALIDYYIEHSKAVGSNTLKEEVFADLSSATIRNYFCKLEKNGYLLQEHSSAGRIPSEKAYRLYAKEFVDFEIENSSLSEELFSQSEQEVTQILENAAEALSEQCSYPVFLSAPRFDHDFIRDVKLINIDCHRCLCVLITNFGLVKTQTLRTKNKLSVFSLNRIEQYFSWRLQNDEQEPENLSDEERQIAQNFYNEVMLRYITGYSNFSREDLYTTGFSKLLHYREFSDASSLASSLGLFENENAMRHLLRKCSKHKKLRYWIGKELNLHSPSTDHCSVLAIPYFVHKSPVGAFAILGPCRMPYKKLFGLLKLYSMQLSQSLTQIVYKFKIAFRERKSSLYLPEEENLFVEQKKQPMLLEDKTLRETDDDK